MLSMRNYEASGAEMPPPGGGDGNGFPPDEEDVNETKALPLWSGWDGLAMMGLGVILPAMMLTISSVICFERIVRIIFKHPVETLVECALLALIPFANYCAWKAVRREDARNPLRLGLLNGTAIATSFTTSAILVASVLSGFPAGFMVVATVAFTAGSTGVYLAIELRNSAGTRQSRSNRVIFSALGVVLSLIGIGACEAKGTAIRIAENMALSDVTADRDAGLDLLRKLGCEQDLRMQCADERTSGIPGMFLRISPERERELYFAVTGKPYGNNLTDSVYSMSDEYLSKHVVGSAVKGLNLKRSAITGYINSETLTGTVNWTFVFKNGTFEQQEARAELALPPGAVISGLTLWSRGDQHEALFGPTDRVQQATSNYKWVDVGTADPALITDLGRGRVLLKCSPIPAQGEMKVQVTLTERLKPLSLTDATLTLPKFVDANFGMSGDHNLRLHAPSQLSSNIKDARTVAAADGGHLLIAGLKDTDLNGATQTISVHRPATYGPFFVQDTKSSRGGFIKETIKEIGTSAPEHLVVVVDNSQSMKGHLKELIAALKNVPKNVTTSVVLPSDGQQMEPVSLERGIELIGKAEFNGGKDNLQAVIKAAEAAGETKHGAVLWVHGPQPSFNQEMYIMAPYIERPSFYELALDDRWTDTNEFFKNHREIGPFVPVARNSGISEDLGSFLSKWQAGGTEFVVELARSTEMPKCKQASDKQADELIRLCTRDECYKMLRDNNLAQAAELATSCRIVTPVTGAVVLGRQVSNDAFAGATSDPVQTAWQQGAQNGSVDAEQYQQHQRAQYQQLNSPSLQGATNGTVVAGASVITGVNTAGTVRVNNLANLEALLNIMANLTEILCVLIGAALFIPALMGHALTNPVKLDTWGRATWGAAIIAFGFAVPGCINWLVASARDANLFS